MRIVEMGTWSGLNRCSAVSVMGGELRVCSLVMWHVSLSLVDHPGGVRDDVFGAAEGRCLVGLRRGGCWCAPSVANGDAWVCGGGVG